MRYNAVDLHLQIFIVVVRRVGVFLAFARELLLERILQNSGLNGRKVISCNIVSHTSLEDLESRPL
jgi:hypothetical protein